MILLPTTLFLSVSVRFTKSQILLEPPDIWVSHLCRPTWLGIRGEDCQMPLLRLMHTVMHTVLYMITATLTRLQDPMRLSIVAL